MGLVVWLPLNGNLENQGCSNITITNNGATSNTAGKIGQCYSFSNNSIYGSIPNINNMTQMSGCCWLYLTNTNSAQYIFHIGGQSSWQCKFSLDYEGDIRSIINGKEYRSGITLTTNTWYHVCVVWDGMTVTWYLNGVKQTSKSTSGTFSASNNYAIGARTNSAAGNTFAYYITNAGKLNDIRIYDHCLSAAEVHKISQGLILHYKLDQPANINNNLYVGSEKFTGTWHNSGSWGESTETYQNFTVRQRGSTWSGLYQDIPCSQNDIFTISFYGKIVSGGVICSVHRSNLGNVTTGLTILGGNFIEGTNWVRATDDGTQWKRYWATVQITSADITYLRWRIENSVSGKTFQICGLKLEKGSAPTPWSPAASEAGETNIIRDSSGYGHNGTITGNISINSNSGRYSNCIYAPSGNTDYITTPTLQLPGDAITMSFWFRSSNQSPGSNYHMPLEGTASSNQSYEMSIYKTGYLRGGLVVAGSRKVDNCTSTKLTDGNWHMCSMTYDGHTIKRYVDGIMEKSTATTGTLITSSSFILGHYGSNTSYYSKEAYTSDVRIYCTALSAADVKQLYEMGAKVDNKGNLHTYEFNEFGSNKLKKTGVFYNYATEPYMQLTDGSCWKLMLFHYVDGGNNLFTSSNATYNDGFGLYSRLRDIDNFKYNNKYEFYVIQDGTEFRWTQTSQPTASSIAGLTTVSGYTNPVNGLARSGHSNTYIGYNSWWGACGCKTSYSTGGKTGIPGFGSHDANGICTTYLALYTRIDKITYRNASNAHYANNLIEI